MSKQSNPFKLPKIGIAFLFVTAVLLSLILVTAATLFALEAGRQETIPASMLAQSEANYQRDDAAIRFGQLNPQIIIEATKDSANLAATPEARTLGESLRNLLPDSLAQLFPTPLPTKLPAPEIVQLDPEILQTAVAINAHTKTPTPMQPTASTTPTTTFTPTSGPSPTATATQSFVATATPWPTVPPTASYTPTFTPPPTQPPSNPPPPPAATNTNTAVPPSNTATATAPATATSTPAATVTSTTTATATATGTAAATATSTATATQIPTDTPTPTATATATATPTATPIPCTGANSSNLNIGPPNGSIATISCGQSITIDLGGTPLDLSPPDGAYDLVYYEMENPPGFISVDWVIIEISTDGSNWIEVLNWGDGNPANNGSIGNLGSEPDNHILPFSALYNGSTTGIAIDADAFVSSGPRTFQYIRVTSPLGGGNDGSEVDSIEILP